jgi:hypothetical protein
MCKKGHLSGSASVCRIHSIYMDPDPDYTYVLSNIINFIVARMRSSLSSVQTMRLSEEVFPPPPSVVGLGSVSTCLALEQSRRDRRSAGS